jgi:hypothetical protein
MSTRARPTGLRTRQRRASTRSLATRHLPTAAATAFRRWPRAPSPALLTLRDQVIAPILAAVRSPRMGRKPAHWTRVDGDYERIRIDMQTLFNDLAIETPLAA